MTQWRANTQPLQSLQFNARNNSNQLERRSNTKHNVMIKAILICKSVSQLRESQTHGIHGTTGENTHAIWLINIM